MPARCRTDGAVVSRVTILCSDPGHPVMPWLADWAAAAPAGLQVEVAHDVAEAKGGDFLFLVSCSQIVTAEIRDGYRYALVIHASALPKGRGWSPHIWSILDGADHLSVTLLDAADPVDSGSIWHQLRLPLVGNELHDEINAALFAAEIQLLQWAIENCQKTLPVPQTGEPTYYRRRRPADSQIDVDMTLREAFDLIRVSDPTRYPAFFDHLGRRYKIMLEKIEPVPHEGEEKTGRS